MRGNYATLTVPKASGEPLTNPITGIVGRRARAASGHAAAPPRSVMNSRRLMGSLPCRPVEQVETITGSLRCASQQNRPPDFRIGSTTCREQMQHRVYRASVYSMTSSASTRRFRRNFHTERFGSFQVDNHLKFDRPHDRKVGRILALEDAAGIGASLTKLLPQAWSVAHEAAGFRMFAIRINRGHPLACCQNDELHTMRKEQRIG